MILEALASGLPVASVPAPGPADLIEDGVNGALGDDLLDACLRALRCSREAARATALRYSWAASHARSAPTWCRCAPPPAPALREERGRLLTRRSGQPQQRLSHADAGALAHVRRTSSRPAGANTMMVEPCSNQPISSPFRSGASQGITSGPRSAGAAQVEEVEPDAGHQDGRHRHQRDHVAASPAGCGAPPARSARRGGAPRARAGGFTFQASPGTWRTSHHAAVVGRVEAVVHARLEAQRHVAPVACTCGPAPGRGAGPPAVYVWPLAWISSVPRMRPAAPTTASQGLVSAAGSGSTGRAPSLSSRTKQSCRLRKRVFRASLQVQVLREEAEGGEGRLPHQRVLDTAEPAHEAREAAAGDPVGDHEVDRRLLEDAAQESLDGHRL